MTYSKSVILKTSHINFDTTCIHKDREGPSRNLEKGKA